MLRRLEATEQKARTKRYESLSKKTQKIGSRSQVSAGEDLEMGMHYE